MNEAPDNNENVSSEVSGRNQDRTAKTAIVAVVSVVAIVAIAFVLWLFIPRGGGGRPVPAPRTIGPDQTVNQTGSTPGESALTISAEQIQRSGITIETVGERVSADTTGQQTTGVVQPNSYRETPVMSLVGGIVRSIGPELGQSVRKGQTIAVVSSNDLAEAQTKYLTAFAELDEHHKHHARTEKLVAIGAASREELELATTKLRSTESEVANLRQRLLLLGLSSQRVNALHSSSQISSEVSVPSPISGTLTSRAVNPSAVIEANKELMRVTDLSSVWVVGQVYEQD